MITNKDKTIILAQIIENSISSNEYIQLNSNSFFDIKTITNLFFDTKTNEDEEKYIEEAFSQSIGQLYRLMETKYTYKEICKFLSSINIDFGRPLVGDKICCNTKDVTKLKFLIRFLKNR